MKFKFYYKGNKSKVQVIKCESEKDITMIATIAKAETVKKSILKDIDFSDARLVCEVNGKVLNMRELWEFINNKKYKLDKKSNLKKNKNKKDCKLKEKKKSKKDKKKSKKKDKKKNKSSNKQSGSKKNNDGLIHITRRK